MTGEIPLLPEPEDLNEQTVKDYYCKHHKTVMVRDALGRYVCPVCIVKQQK